MLQVTRSVIEAAHAIGLFVRVCVSDMGVANQDMWRTVGVHSCKDSLQNYIQHPCSSSDRLYFMADPPHLLKNVRNSLLTQCIILPATVVTQFGLPSNLVSVDHVRKLVSLQDELHLKLAPALKKAHVFPGQYQKMRVNMASALLGHTTASALRYCVSVNLLPREALSTAWFCDAVNSWFDAMNARMIKAALFKTSAGKLEALNQLLTVIRDVKFTGREGWKPIQMGIQLSTTTILDLHRNLVCNGTYNFLMSGRLTQDCVENLFSCIRGRGDSHPSPVLFRHNLRVISLSQYMHIAPSSSYDVDDSVYFLDFLKTRPVSSATAIDDDAAFVDQHACT